MRPLMSSPPTAEIEWILFSVRVLSGLPLFH
jgi:hypothetical protein